MPGILILAHGSKRRESLDEVLSLVEKVKLKTGEDRVTAAYLQFSPITLEVGVETLIKAGVKEICILPLFLFDGNHVRRDIPQAVSELRQKYPQIAFSVTRHIGDDDRMAEMIVDRVFGK